MCIYICIYVYMYIYIYIYTHTLIYIYINARGLQGRVPQLIFIHIHQLFRMLYTSVSLNTVNVYWWWCMIFCRV